MRKSFTAVLEQGTTFTQDFATEPYEAAWAGEARWFVRVLELSDGGVALDVRPEISPDGLVWCAEGSPALRIEASGLYSFPLRGFGQWLRLSGELHGPDPCVKLIVYLSLKE